MIFSSTVLVISTGFSSSIIFSSITSSFISGGTLGISFTTSIFFATGLTLAFGFGFGFGFSIFFGTGFGCGFGFLSVKKNEC